MLSESKHADDDDNRLADPLLLSIFFMHLKSHRVIFSPSVPLRPACN